VKQSRHARLFWRAFGPVALAVCTLGPLGSSCRAIDFPLRWRWSNPAPHGNHIIDMAFHTNLNLAVQVCERGQIYTSDDLALWISRDSGVTNWLRAVAFSGSRIVISGENGCVLYADSVDNFRPGTLLDGPTQDWLESIAVSPALLVAVGDEGAIYTSNNGIHWKRQPAGIVDWLKGAAYGGGAWVTVGESGAIYASSNGTNWQKRTSGTSQDLERVAFYNGRFTAVGDHGVAIFSTNNGALWFPEPCSATNILYHIAHGNGDRLAVGSNEVQLFDNGGWSNQVAKSGGPPPWTYYSTIGRPGFFLTAGRTGLMFEGYQTNSAPYFWLPSAADDSIRPWLWDIVSASNIYVAVGDHGTVMSSADGVAWNLELVPDAVTNSILLGVGGTTNMLVAVGDQGSLIYSPNSITNITTLITNDSGVTVTNQTPGTLGIFWFPLSSRPTTNDLQGVCASTNLFVVTGDNGTVLTSPDGTNWTQQTAVTGEFLTSVTPWPGGFVATGDNGAIITSPNGTNWTARISGTTNWLYRVRFLAGQLVAVGQFGTILTSPDGVSWRPQNSGTSKFLYGLALIENTVFITGNSGIVLTSTNLTNWTSIGSISTKPLFGAATDSRQLVVVSYEGGILRSPVLPDLTPPGILSYLHATVGPGVAQNLFLFGGKPDQQFTLDRRSAFDTNQWIIGAPLEFIDPSGTFFLLETIFSTNPVPKEFYRLTLTP
jgi:hypothetical protein